MPSARRCPEPSARRPVRPSVRRFAVAGVGLAAVVACAGATSSAAQTTSATPARWSPVRVQRLSTRVSTYAGAAFAPSGRGFVALAPQTRSGATPNAFESASQVRVIGPSGGLGRGFTLPLSTGLLGGAADADGHAVVVSVPRRTPRTVTLRDLTPAGQLVRSDSVPAPDRADPYATLCAGTSGDAVVAWKERKAGGTTSLAMARRPVHGHLSRRSRLTTTTPWAYACSVAPNGRWVLAAAVRPRTGDPSVPRLRAWTGFVDRKARTEVDLGAAPYSTELQTAIDGTGRSFVVWRSQLPDSGFGAGPDETFRVRAASIGADGASTTPAQILETGEGGGGPGRLVASPTGGAALELSLPVLEEDVGTTDPGVALTVAARDGTFSPLALIPDATDQGPLAFRPDGTAIATWSRANAPNLVAAPLSGTSLGPVEDTGLLADDPVFVTPTRSGEPRLFAIHTTRTASTLRSTTRR